MTTATKNSREARSSKAARSSKRTLWSGMAGSLALLAIAIAIEAGYPWVLKVPAQWLAIVALPALIALIKVGLIDEFSFGVVGIKSVKNLISFPSDDELKADKTTIDKFFEVLRRQQDRSVEIKSAADVPGWPALQEHEQEYQRTRFLELVHIYKPSKIRDEAYDISIYIMKHIPGKGNDNQTTGFTEIDHAEFFFGPGWGNRIFIAPNQGSTIGVNTTAWGQFLATCRVIFEDGGAVVLHRYIDFEMTRER
jgi:hypothetical protein